MGRLRHCLVGSAALLLLLARTAPAAAGEPAADAVYQTADAFLAEAFGGETPPARKLWLTRALNDRAAAILGHEPAGLRVTYWRRGARTAWILDEIGKVRPITTGLVVDGGALAAVRVLVYRESRGWEVRHAFFTDQFTGARLDEDDGLDRPIDGIAGATLSVAALARLARLALALHESALSAP